MAGKVGMGKRPVKTKELTKLVHMKAAGATSGEVAKVLGRDVAVVSRWSNREHIKALIEAEAGELMRQGLMPARKTLVDLAIRGTSEEDRNNKDILKLSLDASKAIMCSAGLGGGQPGTVVNQLVNIQGDVNVQSEELRNLGAFLRQQWGCGEVVEGEVSDGSEEQGE